MVNNAHFLAFPAADLKTKEIYMSIGLKFTKSSHSQGCSKAGFERDIFMRHLSEVNGFDVPLQPAGRQDVVSFGCSPLPNR